MLGQLGPFVPRSPSAQAAPASGNDAILDALPLRLHTETACRRGGALGAASRPPYRSPTSPRSA